MIDGRELRFGNLFYWRDPEMDERKGKRTVGIVKSSNIGDSEFMDAIPLTEEWLTDRFGFKTKNNMKFNHKLFPGNVFKGLDCFYLSNVKPCIEYVHQFQNAFYAITGEELEVKS